MEWTEVYGQVKNVEERKSRETDLYVCVYL